MKISTTTSEIINKVGFEKAVELCAKAGFDAWDFSLSALYCYDYYDKKNYVINDKTGFTGDHIKLARELKKIGEDNGIYCNQTHATDPVYVSKAEDVLKKCIEATAEAGAKKCVVHPHSRISAEENVEFFSKIVPFAREHDVVLTIENMWDWDSEKGRAFFCNCATAESYLEHINGVNDEYFKACLDIGHAEMMGDLVNAKDLVYALGDRIETLHIHDNDKIHDSHQIPFSMNIDFPPIIKALHDVGYKGDFTLETSYYLKDYTAENILDGLKNMAAAARKLADMFDSFN